LLKNEINTFPLDRGKVKVQLIAGNWEGNHGSFEPLTPIFLSTIYMDQGGKFSKFVPVDENIFFYVVRGSVKVSGSEVTFRNLVEFNNDRENIEVEGTEESIVLFGHAKPFNEPLVAQGPFVMNTQKEIVQAYQDYQDGKFGSWSN
jgi:redox-sensitive bicupin YhaK (pirin superfamily)